MKEKELREHSDCDICHKKIGASRVPMFFTVKLTRYGLDHLPMQEQQGLGMMIGAPLAMVMGPDKDLAVIIDEHEKTVCFACQDKILEFMNDA